MSGEKERSQMWASLGVTSPNGSNCPFLPHGKKPTTIPRPFSNGVHAGTLREGPYPLRPLGFLLQDLPQKTGPRTPLPWVYLVGQAEGIEPGFYGVDIATRSLGLVSRGFMMDEMASVCLDQKWLSMASIHVLFLANLGVLDRDWGSRGYRYAMMAAGRLCERIYLMSTAMGLGCCGIGALYDDEAAALLGLNVDSRLLYLVAVGPIMGTANNP